MVKIAQLEIETKLNLSGARTDLSKLDSAGESIGRKIGKDITSELRDVLQSERSSIRRSFDSVFDSVGDSGIGRRIGSKIADDVSDGVRSKRSALGSSLSTVIGGLGAGIGISIANSITGAITGAISRGIGSVGGFISRSIETGSNLQSLKIAFDTIIGDATKAQKTLENLVQFAATTPFEMPEIQTAGKQLLAFGFAAEDLIPVLKNVGNVAAGVSQPINDIAVIYGKARVQGRLFAEDINQLTERGIPIIQELAKQFGVAESEIKDLVEDGKVNFRNLEKAFADLSGEGGKFFNLMERQSDSVGGKISNLRDNFTKLEDSLFKAIEPALSSVLDLANDTFKEFSNGTGIFDALNERAIEFQQYLEENPQLAKELAGILKNSVIDSMEVIADLGGDFLGYLKENPDAIGDAVEGFASLIEALVKAVELIARMVGLLQQADQAVGNAADGIRSWVGGNINNEGVSIQNFGLPGAAPAPGVFRGVRLDQDQVRNAAIIARVGREVGASPRDIQIALATAMQESGLRNLNHGDRDSLGLFQQRPSMDWGSRQQVTNPVYAARAFFTGAGTNQGLLDVENRNNLSLTQAAQRVQRSGFPDAYARWEGMSADLLQSIFNQNSQSRPSSNQTPSFRGVSFQDEAKGMMLYGDSMIGKPGDFSKGVGAGIQPIDFEKNKFSGSGGGGGYRTISTDAPIFPIQGQNRGSANITGDFGEHRGDHRHGGEDYAAPTGTNVLAPLDGVITRVAPNNGAAGNMIVMDVIRNGRVETLTFMHLDQILAERGDQVSQGTVIGTVGNTGRSTGSHLHFEASAGGRRIDPEQWLRGATAASPEMALQNRAAMIDAEAEAAERAAEEARRLVQERRQGEADRLRQERQMRDQQTELARREQEAQLEVQSAQASSNPFLSEFLDRNRDMINADREIQDQLQELRDQREDLEIARRIKLEDNLTGGVDYSAAITQIDEMIRRTEELRNVEQEPARIEQTRALEQANQELAESYEELKTQVGDLFYQYSDDPLTQYQLNLRGVEQTHDELKKSIEEQIEVQNQLIAVEGETAQNQERLASLNRLLANVDASRTMAIQAQTDAYAELNRQMDQQYNSYRGGLESTLLGAEAGVAEGRGQSDLAQRLNRQMAELNESMRFSSQIQEIIDMREELELTDTEFQSLINSAYQLNEINLDQISQNFDSLGETIAKGVQPIASQFFSSIIFGSANALDSLKQLGQMLLDMALNNIFGSIMGSLFGGGGGGILGGGGLGIGLGSLPISIPALAEGGIVSTKTLAWIGEKGQEAVIPLDRAEEFGMKKSKSGGVGDIYINVTVSGNGDVKDSGEKGNNIGQKLKTAIISTLIEQQKPGGILND